MMMINTYFHSNNKNVSIKVSSAYCFTLEMSIYPSLRHSVASDHSKTYPFDSLKKPPHNHCIIAPHILIQQAAYSHIKLSLTCILYIIFIRYQVSQRIKHQLIPSVWSPKITPKPSKWGYTHPICHHKTCFSSASEYELGEIFMNL